MHCPFCQNSNSRVVDSRLIDNGYTIRRRRQCTSCERRFTTLEHSILMVTKRSGVVEEFDRDKLIQGVRQACRGRSVPDDKLKVLAQKVEEALRSKGTSQIESNDIGLAILDPLRELDEVGYLRFASVYKSFNSADDFEAEIRQMREKNTGAEEN
ncbi:transcriptional regulator NrdR [Corynebacterium ulceribovis]|uniref:transcriptional regulator NrdR n=1 Tax=Corynebacterium ulceribovis TaxID=487732 RepID=UPI000477C267|nr:transcriptional regulator NrdR [Corynebacterium ulceribovis]